MEQRSIMHDSPDGSDSRSSWPPPIEASGSEMPQPLEPSLTVLGLYFVMGLVAGLTIPRLIATAVGKVLDHCVSHAFLSHNTAFKDNMFCLGFAGLNLLAGLAITRFKLPRQAVWGLWIGLILSAGGMLLLYAYVQECTADHGCM